MKQTVVISDESEYHCGQYIEGRRYNGVYGGTDYRNDGCWIKVDDWVKINNSTTVKITNK